MIPHVVPPHQERRRLLRADCSRCAGLCCVALTLTRSADFAIDKPAGEPCVHLRKDFACRIHERLRPSGFPGCEVFDCFGAGQHLVQGTFAGRDWRRHPEVREPMFAALPAMRVLHELLWYLSEALELPGAEPLRGEIERAYAATAARTEGPVEDLSGAGTDAARENAVALLARVSALVRGGRRSPAVPSRVRARADLFGARLRGADLRGAELRGALLLAADLRDADLSWADLLGADLRDADVRGADLRSALFLTSAQTTAARGDARTRLPDGTVRPRHWQ